jgi:DNA repair ATPase RecN
MKNKKQSSIDGYNNICKLCKKQLNDLYYKNNTLKKIEYANKYQKQDKIKLYQHKYNEIYKKEYYLNNKEKLINYNQKYTKFQYNNNEKFKLQALLRSRFHHALKGSKIQSALSLLGCSIDECKYYLESQFKHGMSWSNHGTVWEIDHIIPCSKFDLTDLEQQKICFHYTNLQPLFKTENRKKSNKI